MILQTFTLLDTKSGIHNPPFFMSHVQQAIRACIELGQDMRTTVGRHPADFMLVELGTFDDQNGQFTNAYQPVATVASLLPAAQPTGLFATNEKEPV